jgi:hypothetical protein
MIAGLDGKLKENVELEFLGQLSGFGLACCL